MPADVQVTVRVVDAAGGEPRLETTITVPHATPAGATWSHLGDGAGDHPPAGLAYVLNGVRTLPAAWLADGDALDLVLPAVDG